MSATGLPAPRVASSSDPATSPRSSPRLAIAAAFLTVLTFGSAWVGSQQLDHLFYNLAAIVCGRTFQTKAKGREILQQAIV